MAGGGGGGMATNPPRRTQGIANIYGFLRLKHPELVVPAHDERILAAEEGGAVVGQLVHDDALCRMAVELFVAAYGSETGNVALKFLPRGGLFIAGGIAPKLLPFIAPPGNDAFARAMADKGRLSTVVAQIPVYVVTATDLGLRGARVVAARGLAPAAKLAVSAAAATAADRSLNATLLFGLGLGVLVGMVVMRLPTLLRGR